MVILFCLSDPQILEYPRVEPLDFLSSLFTFISYFIQHVTLNTRYVLMIHIFFFSHILWKLDFYSTIDLIFLFVMCNIHLKLDTYPHEFLSSPLLKYTVSLSCFSLSGKSARLYHWASLVIQTVKNPPTMWETWVRSLGWEDPLEEGMATHSNILAWKISMDRWAWQATAIYIFL